MLFQVLWLMTNEELLMKRSLISLTINPPMQLFYLSPGLAQRAGFGANTAFPLCTLMFTLIQQMQTGLLVDPN